MIYEKETALLRRGMFDVQNEAGLERHEEMYHQAMILWLEKENIPYSSKKPRDPLGNRSKLWKTKIRNNRTVYLALQHPWDVLQSAGYLLCSTG